MLHDLKEICPPQTPSYKKIVEDLAQAIQASERELQFFEEAKEGLVDKVIVTPTLWSGSVTLPDVPGEAKRYRLVIAEYEEYLIDDATPYDPIPTKKDRRVVFIKHVEITP